MNTSSPLSIKILASKKFWMGLVISAAVLGAWFLVGGLFTEPTPLPIEHQITQEKMNELVTNKKDFEGPLDLFQGVDYEWFNNESLKYVVNNPNALKFVVAFGAKDDGTGCVILYAMDKDNNILEPMLETAHPCPPFCSSTALGMNSLGMNK